MHKCKENHANQNSMDAANSGEILFLKISQTYCTGKCGGSGGRMTQATQPGIFH